MEELHVLIDKCPNENTQLLMSYYVNNISNKQILEKVDEPKAVFITSVEVDDEDEYYKSILYEANANEGYGKEWLEEFTHSVYFVKSSKDILTIILEQIVTTNCEFFIDRCDEIITSEMVLNWISEYSNQDGYNSFDVTMTKLK